ncbi:MAG: hypothetical protein RSE55_04120 [Lachnospiraceae bacterium]
MEKDRKLKMKRKLLCVMSLVIIIGITGCGEKIINKKEPELKQELNNQSNQKNPKEFTYDKYKIDAYTEKYMKPDAALYRKVFDAVDQFQTSVDCSKSKVTQEQTAAVSAAVFSRFEFPYLEKIALSEDGRSIDIQYRNGIAKEEAKAETELFRDKVNTILKTVANTSYSDVENVMMVYNFFAASTYNEEAEDVGCYGIMVNGQGTCTGYAYSIRYILEQMEIPVELAFSEDESHVWNIVKMKGAYYHLDATWESQNNKELSKMNFFGMTDEQRLTDFNGWYGGNVNYTTYELPPCTKNNFSFLRDSLEASADLEQHQIRYTQMDGSKMSYDLKTGESSMLSQGSIEDTTAHTLTNYNQFISESNELKEALQELSEQSGKRTKEEVQQLMIAHLKTLEAAYEQANNDMDFSSVFAGDLKPEYGTQLQNEDFKELVARTYDTGYVLKKDAGYVYPEIDETLMEQY